VTAPDPEQKAASMSLGDLLGNVSRDLSTLFRQEVELAKAEAKESATKAGKAAGMFSGAGIAAFFALLFLSIAAWWGLGTLIGNGWSALVVFAVYLIVALILFLVARSQVKQIRGVPRTVETVKHIPDSFK
jgi:hypothetical protein